MQIDITPACCMQASALQESRGQLRQRSGDKRLVLVHAFQLLLTAFRFRQAGKAPVNWSHGKKERDGAD